MRIDGWSDELYDAVCDTILDQVRAAVNDAKDRDQMMVDYSNMVEGLMPLMTPARWQGACDLQYPLVLNATMKVEGQFIQQLRKEPLVTVSSSDSEDDEDSEAQEEFFIAKAYEIDFVEHLACVAKSTIRYPFGVMYRGWCQRSEYRRVTHYKDDKGYEVPEEHKIDGVDYEEVVRRVPVETFNGVELRVVPSQDFYLYPFDSVSIAKSTGCGERMMVSETDLLLGVDEYDYEDGGDDNETYGVTELIEHGPCRLKPESDNPVTNQDLGGKEADKREDQFYECFMWWCKMPIIRVDGEMITPKHLIGEELLCVCCPAANVVLKLEYSDCQSKRPYVPFWIWPREDKFEGRCIPDMLETLQTNADVISRQYIDALQMTLSPVFKELSRANAKNSNFEFFPNARYECTSSLDEIAPFEVPRPDPQTYQLLAGIKAEAEEITAGANLSLAQKQRKNKEVEAAMQQATQKFDAFFFNFCGLGKKGGGIIELVRDIVMLYAEHMDYEGEEFASDGLPGVKVTPQQLKGKYFYSVIGAGTNGDPAVRLEHAQARAAVAEKYNTVIGAKDPQTNMPMIDDETKQRLWYAAREVLMALDTPRIKNYIGEKPKIQPINNNQPPPILGQMMGAGGANGQPGQPAGVGSPPSQ